MRVGRAGVKGPFAQAVLPAGLTETCRECGQRSLDYLEQLKDRQRLGSAQLGDVQEALRGVLQLAQVGDGAQHSHLPTWDWQGGSQGTLGVVCPLYPQVLVLSLSHLSFQALRPFLLVHRAGHPQIS